MVKVKKIVGFGGKLFDEHPWVSWGGGHGSFSYACITCLEYSHNYVEVEENESTTRTT